MRRALVLFVALLAVASVGAETPDPWEFYDDPVTGAVTVWTRGQPDFDLTSAPVLLIQRVHDRQTISINWGGRRFSESGVDVVTRFDLESPKTNRWIVDESATATLAPGDAESIEFLFEKIVQSSRLVATTTTSEGKVLTLVFRLHGLTQAWIDATGQSIGGKDSAEAPVPPLVRLSRKTPRRPG
jgi:hypothetical protein